MARNFTLRASLAKDKIPEASGDALPTSIVESLNLLEQSELFQQRIPVTMMKGYLAVRRAEAVKAAVMSLNDEVNEALARA